MTSWSAQARARLRLGWLALPILLAMGCQGGLVPGDAGGSGGQSASGGHGPAAGGQSSGGETPGDGANTGGQSATDAPEELGGSSSSGGSFSTGGVPGAGGSLGRTGPCYDEPCDTYCVGSCDDGFVCDPEPVSCTGAITTWCGCDGETFTTPSGCPTKAYDYGGACTDEGASYDCNPDHIVCLPIVAPEPCPDGEVYSVISSCYGDCVPIDHCACDSADDCPDLSEADEYTCHNSAGRCGPWVH